MVQIPSLSSLGSFLALVIAGAAGGWCADRIGAPLPFLLGGLAGGAATAPLLVRVGAGIHYPRAVRLMFVACVGAMIGGTFSPDLLRILPDLPLTLAGVTGFVLTAHAVAYVICRRLGGYDRPTAFFSAMPGGLVEGVALGEASGGDVRVLTLQHFTRVVVVVVMVPLIFSIWSGHLVGSASGQSLARGVAGWSDAGLVCIIALAGLVLGRALRLPAGHMLGAMVLAGVLQASGTVDLHSPDWLLHLSQLMVGVGLASQITGTSLRMAARVVAVSFVMVLAMLLVGVAFAASLMPFVPVPPEILFLSFAPGGIAEMGLIALSLQLSPVLVAAHHAFRIALTVLIATLANRRFSRAKRERRDSPG